MKIEKNKNKKSDRQIIEISSKDNRELKFSLNDFENKIYHLLKGLCFPSNIRNYSKFAEELKRKMSKTLEIRDGWSNYNPKKEYERQKIDFGMKVFICIKFDLN